MFYAETIDNVMLITNNSNRPLIELLTKKAYLNLKRLIQKNDFEIGYEDVVNDILQDMVIYYLNRLPRLGITTEKVADFSFNYSDMPQDILENIDSLCFCITGKHIKEKSGMKIAYDGWNIWQ